MRGERLRQLRESKNLSQADLAEILGINQSQITRWENNENDPKAQSITLLCNFYGVTADYLLGLVDEPDGQISMTDLNSDEQRLIKLSRSGLLAEAMQALARLSQRQQSEE